MSEDSRSEDDPTSPSGIDGFSESFGFDLEHRRASRDRQPRRLSPANRVAKRAEFAPPAGGSLPVLDGEERLVFAADNYLGLTQDDRVQDAAVAAAEVVGTGTGASRVLTGDTLVHRDVEERTAEATKSDRALAFSSRYVANLGAISALDPDVVFVDERAHPSLHDGARLADADTLVYDHCDGGDLASNLTARAEMANEESWLLVTESVFGVDGEVGPLAEICELARRYDAWVLVDETHAVGLYANGGGLVASEGLSDHVHVQTGSFSTALASQGGYVAGSETLIEYLVDTARPFVFSAGLAPPSAAAAAEALHIARTDDRSTRLWRNAEYLRDGLTEMGYEVPGETQILPVRVDDREDAYELTESLYSRGVVAHSVVPPIVPEGDCLIRVTPASTHSASDLAACLDAFRDAGWETNLL